MNTTDLPYVTDKLHSITYERESIHKMKYRVTETNYAGRCKTGCSAFVVS
jgi:hypothetical protein